MIDKTLEIIEWCDPKFWVIENPVGRLSKLRPQLGEPWYFQPHEFAGWLDAPFREKEQYKKKTGLWGKFTKPSKKVLPILPGYNPIMALGGKSERTKELRSMTPIGFSKAFYDSNKWCTTENSRKIRFRLK